MDINAIYLRKCINYVAYIRGKNVLKFGDDRIRIGEVIICFRNVIWRHADMMI